MIQNRSEATALIFCFHVTESDGCLEVCGVFPVAELSHVGCIVVPAVLTILEHKPTGIDEIGSKTVDLHIIQNILMKGFLLKSFHRRLYVLSRHMSSFVVVFSQDFCTYLWLVF